MPAKTAKRSSLERYHAKRDFSQTEEPKGAAVRKARAGELRYLIQKHDATRLHYDFRLELDGTLKSWAVTKGPSLNPADKRLAVHVEDHPLEYGSFEGTIPEGQYGGGTVMLWDEGTWEPVGDPRSAYEKGRLTFVLHGKRLKGEWHLVRMGGRTSGKRDNWLLIKSHDQYADEKNGDRALERYNTSAASGRSMTAIARGNKQWKSKVAKTSRRAKPAKARKTVKKTAKKTAKKATKASKRKSAKDAGDPPPRFIEPQLATLVGEPPSGDIWVHEIKFDGYRALCRINNGEATLLTRSNNDWTRKFQSIADQMADLPIANAILDGEITSSEMSGTTSFEALQQALSNNAQDRLHYYLFDALYLDGVDLRRRTLLERKEALRTVIPGKHPHLHFSEHFKGAGKDVLAQACRMGLEGIISKRADAIYRSGRTEAWLKEKCTNEQEFVIGGFTYQPKHPGRLAALLIGVYEKKDLIFAGKVGTGFDRAESARLVKRLEPLAQRTSPFKAVPNLARRGAIWIKPKLVAQINFTEWTGGNSLRHPSYQGLREDKPAEQVIREKKKRLNPKAAGPIKFVD
jgi:bifunctional non-homologous end joining protein LigD